MRLPFPFQPVFALSFMGQPAPSVARIAASQSGIFPVFLIQPLIWLLLIGGMAAGAMWAKSSYDDRRRDEGRLEVLDEWDKDKARRIALTTSITLRLSGDLMAAKDAAMKQEVQTNVRFSSLETRVARLASTRPVVISADAAGLLDDIARAANRAPSAPADTGTETRAAPIPVAAATVAYDEREFVAWIVKAGAAYADAVNLWAAAREREDLLRATLAKLHTEVRP